MQGAPGKLDFWGKLEPQKTWPKTDWHPLADHCCDVAMVCEALLTQTILGRRLARLAGRDALDATTIARLCVIAALHDIGKFNHGFQKKAVQGATHAELAGHVTEARSALEQSEFCAQLHRHGGFAAFDSWDDAEKPCAFALLIASISHHGAPVAQDGVYRADLWRAGAGRDPVAAIASLVAQSLRWFPEATSSAPPLPPQADFQHAFAGVVMLADWIGSNTLWFPFRGETDPVDRAAFARKAARLAAETLHLNAKPAQLLLGSAPISFRRALPTGAARPLQQTVLDTAPPAAQTVEILEAETGSGKTEAAFLRFLQLQQAGLVDGLYFALPTRTAATQLHARLTKLVKTAYGEDNQARPKVTLAVPGYLKVDDDSGQAIGDWKVRWDESGRVGQDGERWAAESPKRFLAAAIAVGTIDQVLLAGLQVGHAHLRATALLRHLLVVDEVHASDAYMGAILQHVLKWHCKAGGHALLLSATLGSSMRAKLLTPLDKAPLPTLEAAIAAPYPVLWSGKTGIAVDERSADKSVTMEQQPWIDDPRAVANAAVAAARAGAKVLIIRNTVRTCIETQLAVEAAVGADTHLLFGVGAIAAPHHSRYAREDRTLLDNAIEAAFGKESKRTEGCIAVATQTVQQSLDLDADLLITDLCPVDVLLQRIGRLHRHERSDRPMGFRVARAVVLVPAERDLGVLISAKDGRARGPSGLGSVYEDLRVIEATWRLVEKHTAWRIPSTNRELVERGTHPAELSKIGLQSKVWETHQNACLGAFSASHSQAHLVLLPWHAEFSDVRFPPKDMLDVRTRLGADDRVLQLSQPQTGPFGATISRLNVPGWQVAKVPHDAVAVDTAFADATLGIEFGSIRFRYDRMGLHVVQADPATQNDEIERDG